MRSVTSAEASWAGREHQLALVSFGLLTGLIALFLLRDASAFVNSPRDQLVGHVGASAGFTVSAAGALLAVRRRRPHALEIMAAGGVVTVILELAQAFAPTRGVQLSDIAAGFSGVLIAAIGIELVLVVASLLFALRAHVALAICGSIVLLTLLVFDLAPETIATTTPDGSNCPVTEWPGERVRIPLGANVQAPDRCLVTSVGGLGLFGPQGITTLGADSALVSSPMQALSDAILADERIVLRAQIQTQDFDDVAQMGFVVSVRSNATGEIAQIRTRGQRIEAVGPTIESNQRGLAFGQALRPNTRHIVELELTPSELRISVDGLVVGLAAINPEWVDELQFGDEPEAQIFIGNSASRTLPFAGTIDWVEVET